MAACVLVSAGTEFTFKILPLLQPAQDASGLNVKALTMSSGYVAALVGLAVWLAIGSATAIYTVRYCTIGMIAANAARVLGIFANPLTPIEWGATALLIIAAILAWRTDPMELLDDDCRDDDGEQFADGDYYEIDDDRDEEDDDDEHDPRSPAERVAPAFKPGAKLTLFQYWHMRGKNYLKKVEYEVLPEHHMGTVSIPSGRLFAGDPMGLCDAREFAIRFPAGDHPFSIVAAANTKNGEERVAYAVIRFSEKPSFNIVSVFLARDETATIPVLEGHSAWCDSAMMAYGDYEKLESALEADHPLPSYGDEQMPLEGSGLAELISTGTGSKPMMIAVCRTGMGSGVYDSFVGLDADGKPCFLVTDFNLNGPPPRTPPQELFVPRMKSDK